MREPITFQRPMTVFWSRAHRQRHVTICLMKFAGTYILRLVVLYEYDYRYTSAFNGGFETASEVFTKITIGRGYVYAHRDQLFFFRVH